jgi:protein-S-isoprenylcysteine O-methyltransferase Ste14
MPPYEQKEMSRKKEIKNILNIILVLFFVYLCYVIETHKHSTGNIRIGVYLCLVILVLAVFIKVNFTLKQIQEFYNSKWKVNTKDKKDEIKEFIE